MNELKQKLPTRLASKPLRRKPSSVDRQHSIIEGALVVCEGEAKGHGIFLDSEFVDTVIAMGNAAGSNGIKARFGHPNMCSSAIGTFLGRWKNFRRDSVRRTDGSIAAAARADLCLSNSAAKTPKGNLKEYVMDLADNESDMFGTSIVFTPGKQYRRDKAGKKAYRHIRYHAFGEVEIWYTWEKDGADSNERLSSDEQDDLSDELYVECEDLHADDVVDEPAANDGMFSEFSSNIIAAEFTEFLDLNPEVVTAFQSNPDILEALSTHHAQVKQFIDNYLDYTANHDAGAASKPKEDTMSEEKPVSKPEQPETPAPSEDLETTPAPEETETPEDTPEDTPAEPEQPADEPEDEPLETPADPENSARAEFNRMVEDFGAEIAAATFAAGGSYDDAMRAAYKAGQDRIEQLENQLAEAGGSGDDGISHRPTDSSNKPKKFEDFFKSKKK